MDQDTTISTTPEQQPEAAPANPAANLSLQDLLLVVNLIQVISQRGGFRAEEMSNIGSLYDRLVAFLVASGAIKTAQDAPQADAPQADAPAADEAPSAPQGE